MAVIGPIQHDHVITAGMRPRQPQRQVVGFAAGVDEVAHAERRRQRGRQPLGVAHQMVVQITGVRVQQPSLVDERGHHTRMLVAHVRHVVVRIQMGAAFAVDQPDVVAAHDLQRRIAVADAQIGPQAFGAALHQVIGCAARALQQLRRQTQKARWW
jgi:hypothetical protein